MNKNYPNTVGSLSAYLGRLKEKVNADELSFQEYKNKEKEILNEIDKIVSNTDFNGVVLLNSEDKLSITIENSSELEVKFDNDKRE